MMTKNVPNLQNTIQKWLAEVNMQLNSIFNLPYLDNRSLHNRDNVKYYDLQSNRLDITRSAHYNLPVSKSTSVCPTR